MSAHRETGMQWPVIGHEHAMSYLQQTLVNDTLSHAYLFVGPTHVGKLTLARFFVNALLCTNRGKAVMPVPCGQCSSCQHNAHHNHPDVSWISRMTDEKTGKMKKNISIDQIRDLTSRVSLKSFLDGYKIGVVDEAETLSIEAANALLKTLEEPPGKTLLIIIASHLSSLPATITSRCQIIRFGAVPRKSIERHVSASGLDEKKSRMVAALSFGRPGVAMQYAHDADALAELQEHYKGVVSLLHSDVSERLAAVTKLSAWYAPDRIAGTLDLWRQVIRDLLLIKGDAALLVSNPTAVSTLQELARTWSMQSIISHATQIDQTEQYISANVNSRFAFEQLLLSY